jgi:hypothetical protein
MSQRKPKRCENCRYWPGDVGDLNTKWSCQRLPTNDPNARAQIIPAAKLFTAWNFFCNLHEWKEN